MTRHLRKAAHRLRRARLSREERLRLDGLLRPAVHRVEDALRDRFRPRIETTLESAGVRPANLPERVAYRQARRGDDRPDRRPRIHQPGRPPRRRLAGEPEARDLSGPGEFIRGDRLLQTDRALAHALDGVHRKGEVYLRWLQRFSALAFGTPIGRFLTRYLAIPFGGAFVLLKGIEEIDELTVARLTGHHPHLVNPETILLLGTLALGMINFARLRRAFFDALRAIGRALRIILVDLPAGVLNHPMIRRLIDSPVAKAAWRLLIKPALVTAPVWAGRAGSACTPIDRERASASRRSWPRASCSTPAPGGRIEEMAAERISHALRGLIFEVIPGLFHLIMSACSTGMIEWVEKADLRRGRMAPVPRGAVARGCWRSRRCWGWSGASWPTSVRVYLNLLIEPQINPIKHFPVVTVAAKILLPFVADPHPDHRRAADAVPGRAGRQLDRGHDGVLPARRVRIPGLGAADRTGSSTRRTGPRRWGRSPSGSHGETVVRLLRPGFHSGTLPKRFARLRRARRAGTEPAALKHREALASRRGIGPPARRARVRRAPARAARSAIGRSSPGSIHLATNRIRVELLGRRPGPAQPLARPGGAVGRPRRRNLATRVAGKPGPRGSMPIGRRGRRVIQAQRGRADPHARMSTPRSPGHRGSDRWSRRGPSPCPLRRCPHPVALLGRGLGGRGVARRRGRRPALAVRCLARGRSLAHSRRAGVSPPRCALEHGPACEPPAGAMKGWS